MFAWIKQLFRSVEFEAISLAFELALDEAGKHTVRVYEQVGENRQLVQDVERLWTYGCREEPDDPFRVRIVSEIDRQTLYALRILKPTPREDGSLVLELTPHVLSYLRTKPNVEEDGHSRELYISDTPARPSARINFDPATGIYIEAGYCFDDEELVPSSQIANTADGGYIRRGNAFWVLPTGLGETARNLLHDGQRLIRLNEIPAFIQGGLQAIKKEFRLQTDSTIDQLQILKPSLVPVITLLPPSAVAIHPEEAQEYVDFQIDYVGGEARIPHRDLTEQAKQGYYRSSSVTWIAVDSERVEKIQAKLEELGAVPVAEGYHMRRERFTELGLSITASASPPESIVPHRPAVARPLVPRIVAPSASPKEQDRFVEIVPRGLTERRSPQITISVHHETPGASFLDEAKRYHSRVEAQTEHVAFMQYWPTYGAMNSLQQRWYFYWRSQVREGKLLATDLSYIFVHVYELLNLVEVTDPGLAANRLKMLWEAYRPQHPKLDNYLPDWSGDLLAFWKGANTALAWWEAFVPTGCRLSAEVVNLIIHRYVESGCVSEMPYSLWTNLMAYRPRNKFYKEHNTGGALDRAYAQAIWVAEEYSLSSSNESLLRKFTTPISHPMRKALFSSALVGYSHADSFELGKSRNYLGDARLSDHLTAVVKYAENILRKQTHYSSRLSGIKLTSGLEQALEGAFAPKPVPPPPVHITIDAARVASLHQESEQIGAMLESIGSTEPSRVQPKALYSDLAEARQLWAGLSAPYRVCITNLYGKKITTVDQLATQLAPHAILPALFIDAVNEQALKLLGDRLIYEENGGTLSLAEDFLDELKVVIEESPPEAVSAGSPIPPADSIWDELFARLGPAEIELIRLVAQNGRLAEIETEAATRPYHVMPNAALDGLNEKTTDALGHPMLYMDGDRWKVDEDDLKYLRQHLSSPETS